MSLLIDTSVLKHGELYRIAADMQSALALLERSFVERKGSTIERESTRERKGCGGRRNWAAAWAGGSVGRENAFFVSLHSSDWRTIFKRACLGERYFVNSIHMRRSSLRSISRA